MRSSSSSSSTSSSRSSSPLPEETIQIFVKNLVGDTITLAVPPSLRVADLHALLSVRSSIPTTKLRLVFAGKHLDQASSTLSDYAIQRESTLHLVLPLRGGMPASKKQRCTFRDCKHFAQRVVGDCSFCNGNFCGTHRLLEDHKCSGLDNCKQEAYEANADKLLNERTTVIKGV